MDFTQEKDFQNEIANNENLQRDICSCLDIKFYAFSSILCTKQKSIDRSEKSKKSAEFRVVVRGRIELPTRRFSVCCSTD